MTNTTINLVISSDEFDRLSHTSTTDTTGGKYYCYTFVAALIIKNYLEQHGYDAEIIDWETCYEIGETRDFRDEFCVTWTRYDA